MAQREAVEIAGGTKPNEHPALSEVEPWKLRDAGLVGIVVHGVGDHTPSDILGELLKGLDKSQLRGHTATRYQLKDFPLPDGTTGFQDVMRIDSQNGHSFILPVVWSRLRLRAGKEIGVLTRGERFPPSLPFVDAVVFFLAAVPALVLLGIHSFFCVPKARGTWKILIFVVACCMFAGMSGFT